MRKFTLAEFKAMQERFALWKMENPKATSSEELIALMRLYEIHNYGVTSKDLTLGKSIDYIYEDGAYRRVEAAVNGIFYCDPNKRGELPTCMFNRAKFKLSDDGKRLSFKEFVRDAESLKTERLEKLEEIRLSVADTGTATASGKSLLESAIDTGFGSSSGVIRPVFMNMLLELVSIQAFMKNFVSIEPMDDATFYFPMKTSVVTDDSNMTRTALPTPEGLAGTDHSISYDRYEINAWKFLRHAELTDEVNELIGKFINVQSHYVEDLAQGQALLWDWPILEGILTMIVRGTWRRPKKGTPWTWDITTEIPWGKASVLTTNAKLNYLFQDMSGTALTDGIIYEPAVTTGNEFKYDSSTVRQGSTSEDETYEGIMALASLLKDKNSALEYVILSDSKQTERLFKDGRFLDARMMTGNPKFQDERGYLGRVAIGGSSTQTDVWEAPNGLVEAWDSDDTPTADVLTPIIGGRYGRAWHHGVLTPLNMRVDRGMEVKAAGVGSANVLRDNETMVITTSTKGSSWPGDYHDAAILWQALADGHA